MAAINIDDMLKAQQWERVKGELRAFVSMQGSYASTEEEAYRRWSELQVRAERFIRDIEDDGLEG